MILTKPSENLPSIKKLKFSKKFVLKKISMIVENKYFKQNNVDMDFIMNYLDLRKNTKFYVGPPKKVVNGIINIIKKSKTKSPRKENVILLTLKWIKYSKIFLGQKL